MRAHLDRIYYVQENKRHLLCARCGFFSFCASLHFVGSVYRSICICSSSNSGTTAAQQQWFNEYENGWNEVPEEYRGNVYYFGKCTWIRLGRRFMTKNFFRRFMTKNIVRKVAVCSANAALHWMHVSCVRRMHSTCLILVFQSLAWNFGLSST